MRFFNNDIYSNPGDPIEIIYSPVVSEDGTIGLEESGKINIQEEIDSYEESCALENVIKRYVNGDTTALNQHQAKYGDFTQFPKTYAEVLQLQIDSNNLFNSLPVDIKQKFDNDANKFFVMSGSDEWNKILSPLMKKETVEEKVEEIKEVVE